MGILMILCMSLMVKPGMKMVAKLKGDENQKLTIVVDAGHGGKDPGKVGINGALEKDINLSIARKLKACFEEEDIEVVLTRKDDQGLYHEDTRNKKVEDMQNRCKIINETKPNITISLHQNSYHEQSVCGPQVFFHGQSKEGEELAHVIQDALIRDLKPLKERSAKANESYYLLTKTGVPTVIIECGFLSNKQEAELLVSDDYQEKMAAAICSGVIEYLDSK